MNYYVVAYFAILVAMSCVAAYSKRRTPFMLIFALTLLSIFIGILGGKGGLYAIVVGAGVLAFSAGMAYSFREFLALLLPYDSAQVIRTAPLTASFGLFVIAIYAIAGIFAPYIAPFGEAEVIATAFAPADETMLLGADQLGRDMFSRIIFGARNTVGLALLATSLAFIIGAVLGMIAATVGGWVDQALGRMVDVIMSIPSLIFSLLLLSIFGTGIATLVVVIAVIYAPRVYRLTRAVAGNIVVMDYIEAARLRGERIWYLIFREILPNASAPLVAEFGLEFCFVFLLVAGLSFLGLGIQPPTADWGAMVRENATLISFGEIVPLIPAAAISLLTVAVNFVVDWMLYRSSGLKEK